MADDRESPSAGWREVYHEMEANADAEAATARCPDCGRWCRNVLRDVYECKEHGVFRRPAGPPESERTNSGERVGPEEKPNPEEGDETKNRTPGRAD